MTRWRWTTQGLLFAAIGWLAGCGGSGSADDTVPEVLRLQTGWYAQPETGGYFYAETNGYYAEEGLDLRVQPGSPGSNTLQLVVGGQAEFGISRVDDCLMAAGKGMPILILGAYNQKPPLGLMFHASNPIEHLDELAGQTVMVKVGAPVYLWMEQERGIDFNAIPHDYGMGRFLSDPEFIQQAFLTNEPYHARRKGGIETKMILFANEGYTTFNALFTTLDFAAKHPEVVRKVVEASARGWRDFMTTDPTSGLARIAELSPHLTPEYLKWTHAEMLKYSIVEGRHSFDEAFYAVDRDVLERQVEILKTIDLLPADFPVEKHVTWDFNPEPAAIFTDLHE